MIARLGRILLLAGLLCLALFFTSNTFLVDEGWFLLGGIGCTALGLLLRRGRKSRRKRRGRASRRSPNSLEEDDGTD